MTEDEFDAARLVVIESMIIAVETALLTAPINGPITYSFDDGQTRQSVTRSSRRELLRELQDLTSMRATYRARLGYGQINVRPGF